MSHFIECLEVGQRPLTNGYRNMQTLRVIGKLYTAEEQGIIVDRRDWA